MVLGEGPNSIHALASPRHLTWEGRVCWSTQLPCPGRRQTDWLPGLSLLSEQEVAGALRGGDEALPSGPLVILVSRVQLGAAHGRPHGRARVQV